MRMNWGAIFGAISVILAVGGAVIMATVWFNNWRTTENFRFDAMKTRVGGLETRMEKLESRMNNLENQMREIRILIEERLPAP